ncbi:MAG TPA: flagellar biosynthetic protein FliQ [Terracidiphilus sp.]|jgi:flagellar biosynthetic protein FliQ
MDVDQVVLLGRMMLQEVIILAGPILGVAIVVSLLVNVAQVLTSLQDTTISSVTRLLATGGALFFSMPWMWRQLSHFTLNMFSDFHVYLQ